MPTKKAPTKSETSKPIEIVHLPVKSLEPYAANSRTHSSTQVDQVASSIKEFGFTNPVLVDEKSGIIAGHCRVLAAKKLNMDTVPCVRLVGLTAAQKRAYVIADNRIALNAGWNDQLLRSEIKALAEQGFDIPVLGFESFQIEAYTAAEDESFFGGNPNEEDRNNQADNSAEPTKSQNGFAAFTVVLPVASKQALVAAVRNHQEQHGLKDTAAALLHLAGITE